MLNHRRNPEAARRIKERREREDAAPRIHAAVPRLLSLSLQIRESRDGQDLPEVAHVRRIIIERAPALFEIPCADPGCQDGGHDVTREVMAALRAAHTTFQGQSECGGEVGNGHCGRLLHYVGAATYSD